jgi:hemoglobin-like flavoprotein
MQSSHIALVQESFRKVVPISEVAAGLFYARLFETAPQVREMFPADLTEQKRKLMAMLATAVAGLTRIETIAPALAALAVRHAEYGVEPHQYGPVGESLIWTLEQGLGDEFTPDTREAWIATYTFIAEFMKEAAASAEAQA